MTGELLISVILPVYNGAQWLAQCLDSILASAGAEPEIILVNDGSTDESGSICCKYAEEHSNIHVFAQENRGVAAARNLGLSHARGDYIAWVDPDDLVSPEWYPEILRAIRENSPDVIVFDMLRFGDGPETAECYGRTPGQVDRAVFLEDVYRDVRMHSGLPNKVMKASLYRGTAFDTGLPVLEDFAAMPRLLKRAETVFYIPKALYRYRQHSASLLHRSSPERAFQSVMTAAKREAAAPAPQRKAAITAAALQALSFSWHCYREQDFGGGEEQLRFCRRYIRRHMTSLLGDRELAAKRKIQFCLVVAGLYGPLQRLRN